MKRKIVGWYLFFLLVVGLASAVATVAWSIIQALQGDFDMLIAVGAMAFIFVSMWALWWWEDEPTKAE